MVSWKQAFFYGPPSLDRFDYKGTECIKFFRIGNSFLPSNKDSMKRLPFLTHYFKRSSLQWWTLASCKELDKTLASFGFEKIIPERSPQKAKTLLFSVLPYWGRGLMTGIQYVRPADNHALAWHMAKLKCIILIAHLDRKISSTFVVENLLILCVCLWSRPISNFVPCVSVRIIGLKQGY